MNGKRCMMSPGKLLGKTPQAPGKLLLLDCGG